MIKTLFSYRHLYQACVLITALGYALGRYRHLGLMWLCLKKCANFETKIIRTDFDDIWQKYSKYSTKKQTYTKTETYKIHPYNFELLFQTSKLARFLDTVYTAIWKHLNISLMLKFCMQTVECCWLIICSRVWCDVLTVCIVAGYWRVPGVMYWLCVL